jgi:predicted acetyltransferase
MEVDVVPVPLWEKTELWAIYQEYAGELAPYVNLKPVNGVFADPRFDLYWTEERRWPFWASVSGKRAGFALVHFDGEHNAMRMGEFYVAAELRNTGVGMAFAQALLAKFPGPWRIRQIVANAGATAFWRRVAAPFGYSEVEFDHNGIPRIEQALIVR